MDPINEESRAMGGIPTSFTIILGTQYSLRTDHNRELQRKGGS